MLATLDIHLMPRALYLLLLAVVAHGCVLGMAWPLFHRDDQSGTRNK